MIALNEIDPTAAEVPFFLPTTANPLIGLTGHNFSNNATTGEVQVKLPGGAWFNVPGSQIVEKGFGLYVVQLTSSQTATAGLVSVRAVVSGAQPESAEEYIGTTGGEIAVAADGYLPFYLPNATDPIYGSPITGHTFVTGEVKICLPHAVGFSNANLPDVSEIGFGAYALKLTAASSETTIRGKAYIHVDIGGTSQPFTSFVTILNASGSSGSSGASTTVLSPVPSPYSPSSPAFMDHTADAVNRLCEQFRAKAA